MNFHNASFLQSAHTVKQLPEPLYPEIAFAGRSNVGKSSLINSLVSRRNLVKTSARPGKTQSLNFFIVDNRLFLVDLPGYGYAKVSREMRTSWDQLITRYLLERGSLVCVVVIIDVRHELKEHDRSLVGWLRNHNIPFLPVYTKSDKLSGNALARNAAALDAALTLHPGDRIVFSAKTGKGLEELKTALATYLN
ncbi:MAG: ribosome biogenesis GTP-binding protein YihA/YsxC [Desulfobulbaceae bacterium]|nr:ribosome biogenesis GTP-binding protein YihA/YsxC [Desulfobulbaceae bacterium]